MKKFVSVTLVVCSMLSFLVVAGATGRFYDVPGSHWAYSYINQLAEKGIINGYADGSFKPDNFVTRGEYAIWLYPVGIEIIDEYTGELISSDVTQVRLYAGQDHCPEPENIYYRQKKGAFCTFFR